MVQYQRYYHYYHQQLKKEEEEVIVGSNGGSGSYYKRAIRPKLMSFIFLSLLSCTLIWAPHFFGFSSTFSLLYSLGAEDEQMGSGVASYLSPCSSMSNGSICCDRSKMRTDICYMKGDIRTHSSSFSVYLYTKNKQQEPFQTEKIKPYTRKWENSVMSTVDELSLVSKPRTFGGLRHKCDVFHDVPAVFFSTGGYTGNVYHEFNDGIIPLYITSQHFHKKVVFVILEYHTWWLTKYGDILSHLTDYPLIDYNGDNRTHCFPESIVGLDIHDELTIDQTLTRERKSIRDFRKLLDQAYRPRIMSLILEEQQQKQLTFSPSFSFKEDSDKLKKPKLAILSRHGSRAITNEDLLVKLGEKLGFEVEVVKPERTTELAKIYRALNSSDVMIGVHGAAMTHFLFSRPTRVFIQIVPLGTDWAAETYYGGPAVKLGLKYIGYKILPRESSLYKEYDRNDPVLSDPESVNSKGWEYTKRIYLDNQNVNLDLRRFEKRLVCAYDYLASKNSRG